MGAVKLHFSEEMGVLATVLVHDTGGRPEVGEEPVLTARDKASPTMQPLPAAQKPEASAH